MVEFKSKVNQSYMNSRITSIYSKLDEIFKKYTDDKRECVITSVREGRHGIGPGSLHYIGRAIDVRTRDMSKRNIQNVLIALRSSLGKAFQVVDETLKPEGPHIHIEYDPKDEAWTSWVPQLELVQLFESKKNREYPVELEGAWNTFTKIPQFRGVYKSHFAPPFMFWALIGLNDQQFQNLDRERKANNFYKNNYYNRNDNNC